MPTTPITEDELRSLDAVQTVEQWDAACTAIKAARGGVYPYDWWHKVKVTGLMDMIFARWGETPQLKITTIDGKEFK